MIACNAELPKDRADLTLIQIRKRDQKQNDDRENSRSSKINCLVAPNGKNLAGIILHTAKMGRTR